MTPHTTKPSAHRRWNHLLSLLLIVPLAPSVAAGAQESEPGAGYRAIHGRETFRSFCSSCHGRDADGTGRVAQYLTIKPADLTRISERNDGEFPRERVYQIIDGRESVKGHGTKDMPVWGDVFQTELASDTHSDETPEQRAHRKIEELVAFLRSIQLETPDSGESAPNSESAD